MNRGRDNAMSALLTKATEVVRRRNMSRSANMKKAANFGGPRIKARPHVADTAAPEFLQATQL